MAAPRGMLTDIPEVSAYVLAHAAGIAWGLTFNSMIFRGTIAQGYRDHLLLAGIAMSIAVSVVVLLIFLFLRKVMAGSGVPPPPADLPAPPAKFTDLREISAYVLAHAAGIAWGATMNPIIFRSFIAQAYQHYLLLAGIAISTVASVVVLLIFLFLRKAMAGSGAPT